ncbi:hypothetical protein BMETH_667_2 [methanotrophic bacterial endosymbiont of Bathymodiolus sp.]|nr:hypothetical protein BMETH_667_2 [methanotrophic bacterial endosymbiont of Bathymodiolus sp.]
MFSLGINHSRFSRSICFHSALINSPVRVPVSSNIFSPFLTGNDIFGALLIASQTSLNSCASRYLSLLGITIPKSFLSSA